MVTYDEALEIAKSKLNGINTCVEYKKGYMFAHEGGEFAVGGANAPVVILKDNGRAVTMPYFVALYGGEPVKTIKVK